MPDASGSQLDLNLHEPTQVNWAPAVEKLQAVHDDAEFQQAEPELTKRTAKLLAEIGEGANLRDEQIRTRIAYLVSDIDRATETSLVLPLELRSEVDDLAVSYPGLHQPDIQEMLRQTSSLGARDYKMIQDVRILARDYVNRDPTTEPQGTDKNIAERTKVMEARVRNSLAGPEAPPHAEVPEHNAVSTTSTTLGIDRQDSQPTAATQAAQPQASQPQAQTRQQANQAQAQQQTQQAPQPQADRQGQAQQQAQQTQQPQPQPQPAGSIPIPMSAASSLLNRLTQGHADGPPPWRGVAQALSDRLAPYQQAQADRLHRDLERSVEVSGKAAVKALAALDTGPAADVMRKIGQEAAKDPNGATGVIEQMRPGGKHETLRNELNTVFAQDKGFAAAFDRSKAALGQYLESRDGLEDNYRRRGWNVADLDRKLGDTDRAIAGVAERTPGRESGKSLSEELAKKAAELAEALYEKVRAAFGKIQSAMSPEANHAASPSPSMSPM